MPRVPGEMGASLLEQSVEVELPELSQAASGAAERDEGGLDAASADAGPGALFTQQTLGVKVMALGMIAPTLLNWLVLVWACWIGTAELVDSEGVAHPIPRYRNFNFEFSFYGASIVCVSSLFAHFWLTAGAIARRFALDQVGARDGEGYASRLAKAEAEARRLSKAEWAHVAIIGFDAFFATFVVFPMAYGYGSAFAVGIGPGLGIATIARQVVTPGRAIILRKQHVGSVAFVGKAFRGSMVVLAVQILVLAR